MPHVLMIGYAPEAVDTSDPALPPGIDVSKIAAGVEEDMRRMRERGWDADFLAIRPDEDLHGRVIGHLAGKVYDCIVIGGGVRMTANHVPALEQVVNAIRRAAPQTPIAFNEGLSTSREAAERWL